MKQSVVCKTRQSPRNRDPMRKVDKPKDVHLLRFQAVENFRELGGYTALDGRQVRWQKLFRSAHFADSTAFDLEQLASLNITGRIDLRSRAERQRMVTKWPSSLDTRLFTVDVKEENEQPEPGLFDQILDGQITLGG